MPTKRRAGPRRVHPIGAWTFQDRSGSIAGSSFPIRVYAPAVVLPHPQRIKESYEFPLFYSLNQHWLFFTAATDLVVALVASAHVVLTKRDSRSAIAWVGLIWLTPLFGAALYLWPGINRIQHRARLLRSGHPHPGPALHQETCLQELLIAHRVSPGRRPVAPPARSPFSKMLCERA